MAYGYLSPTSRGTGGGSLFDLNRQINRMFDDLFDQRGDSAFYAQAGIAAPAMDVHRGDDKIEITAELPGVKEDDVELTVHDGVLTLRGEKKSTRTDEQRGYSERSYGSFERRITLPQDVDADVCTADFADGVLTITLPINEEKSRGKRIPLGKRSATGNRAEESLIEQRETPRETQRDRAKERETA